MGIQSERFYGGKTEDMANLNDEYFCTGRQGYFTTIPEHSVNDWIGSFLDVRDIIEHADDDEAVALAELYGIDVGDGIEGDE